MSQGLPFAVYGVFEVREDDAPELLESENVVAAFQYTDLDIADIFDQIKHPEAPGFYTFWCIGHVEFGFHDTYEGSEDFENMIVETQLVEPAKQGCMEYLKNLIPELTWPFEEVTMPEGGAFLVIDKRDYQMHEHQHEINNLILNDEAYIAESKQLRYKPDQLRFMASAQIRGLTVDLKTGAISVPLPKE